MNVLGTASSIVIVLAALCVVPALPALVGAFEPVDGERIRTPVPTGWSLGVLTGVVVAAFAAALNDHVSWLPAYAYLGVTGVLLAVIDIRVHRLPDAITLPSYPILAALFGLAAVVDGDLGRWWRGLLAAAVVSVVSAGLWALPGAGLGFGDVKLAGLLGGALGWLGASAVLTGFVVGMTLAGMWALLLLVTRRASLSARIAYGPFLLAGAFVAIVGWPARP
ncbi:MULTISPECIES: prepilin peptidase [unclassified Frankia]|uniref:prepilin peptidase n=1 Tax=unclassified Frankia TaxID=2632575 RepID=UPI001EF56C27|nr:MULTISPECIES: prepilin peptidase [unclassified Frankia]